jgi:hypothetical protein
VDKVFGPTCRSAGLLAGRVHLTGTSGTLVGGDPWVPMSLNVISPPLRHAQGLGNASTWVIRLKGDVCSSP